MSIHGTYRGLVVVVAVFVLLGLADSAFSYRLANFATAVARDVVAEALALATPSSSTPQGATASAGRQAEGGSAMSSAHPAASGGSDVGALGGAREGAVTRGRSVAADKREVLILPEPGMLAMFGIGLLALAARIRFRPNRV